MKGSGRRGAVIDIGSNTIKILLGERGSEGLTILLDRTVECRISAGMYAGPPQLTEEAMDAAASAVAGLFESAKEFSPDAIEVIATSAVRDAGNRDSFRRRIRERTGLSLKVLSGLEEAEGIAAGVAQEPQLREGEPYTISDLGGGSLEWILSSGNQLQHAFSWNLGAVRLLHQFVPQPEKPLNQAIRDRISQHCRKVFKENLDGIPLDRKTQHWGTGGAFTISRLLLATEKKIPLEEQPQEIKVSEISRVESILSSLPLSERQRYPGLPPSRADILPVAQIIILTLAEITQVTSFHHSFHNLRMGWLARLVS